MGLKLITRENIDEIFSKYDPIKHLDTNEKLKKFNEYSIYHKLEKIKKVLKEISLDDADYNDAINFISNLKSLKKIVKVKTFFGNDVEIGENIYFCIFLKKCENDNEYSFEVSYISEKEFDILCDKYYYDDINKSKWPKLITKEFIERR